MYHFMTRDLVNDVWSNTWMPLDLGTGEPYDHLPLQECWAQINNDIQYDEWWEHGKGGRVDSVLIKCVETLEEKEYVRDEELK